VAAVLLLIGMSAGGCYRKVVSAHGFGADEVQTQPGNISEDKSGPRTLGYPTTSYKKLPGDQ
jgi:hypothetical protein